MKTLLRKARLFFAVPDESTRLKTLTDSLDRVREELNEDGPVSTTEAVAMVRTIAQSNAKERTDYLRVLRERGSQPATFLPSLLPSNYARSSLSERPILKARERFERDIQPHLPGPDQFSMAATAATRYAAGSEDPWNVMESVFRPLTKKREVSVPDVEQALGRLKDIQREAASTPEVPLDPWLVGRTLHVMLNGETVLIATIAKQLFNPSQAYDEYTHFPKRVDPEAIKLIQNAASEWEAENRKPLPGGREITENGYFYGVRERSDPR